MAQAGRLGPDWWLSDDAGKPLDVSNWDTLGGDGIFTHTALTPYQSLEELSSPYYKDLKPGYLDSVYEGGIKYDLIGNNEADLNQIASTNAGIIKSTEAGAKHYQYLLN
ncbi:MAG: hypothetical protein EOM41_08095 [Bacilli bacterium]|nr:hypothetical protein [Bacilli bacterium]